MNLTVSVPRSDHPPITTMVFIGDSHIFGTCWNHSMGLFSIWRGRNNLIDNFMMTMTMTPEVQTLVDSRNITKPLVEVLFVGQWRLRKQWRVVISVRHMENSAKTSGVRSFRSDYWLMLARSFSFPGTAVWLLLQKSSSETRWNKLSSELCAMHPRNFSGCTRASCPLPK